MTSWCDAARVLARPAEPRSSGLRAEEEGRSAHLSRPQRQLHCQFEALFPGAPSGRHLVLAARLHLGLAGPCHLQPSTPVPHRPLQLRNQVPPSVLLPPLSSPPVPQLCCWKSKQRAGVEEAQPRVPSPTPNSVLSTKPGLLLSRAWPHSAPLPAPPSAKPRLSRRVWRPAPSLAPPRGVSSLPLPPCPSQFTTLLHTSAPRAPPLFAETRPSSPSPAPPRA